MDGVEWIGRGSELADLCQAAKRAGLVALDTEFIGEHTYFSRLALLQVATGDRLALVDPLSVDDPAPFVELLLDPDVEKVLHASSQDLVIFHRLAAGPPCRVYDTQIAAAHADVGAQISYARLVGDLLEVELRKGQQYTNWMRRPLTASQLRYAANDVRYLLPARQVLETRLRELGRVDLALEAMQTLVAPERFEVPPATLAKRVRGTRGLEPAQRLVLEALAVWRDDTARARDCPRRMVATDGALVAIARGMPTSRAELDEIAALHDDEVHRSSERILDAVQSGLAAP